MSTTDRATGKTCVVIHGQARAAGQTAQGLNRFPGISAESAGATGLCMHLQVIPPGARAKAHLHEQHESTLYVISGRAGMWFGEGLQEHLTVEPGDFLYIPAGMPHKPYNLSDTEPAIAIVARTDPREEESVRLLPALDEQVAR